MYRRRIGASAGTRAYWLSLGVMPSVTEFRTSLQADVLENHRDDIEALICCLIRTAEIGELSLQASGHMADSQTISDSGTPDANGCIAAYPPSDDEASEYEILASVGQLQFHRAWFQARAKLRRLCRRMMRTLEIFDSIDSSNYPERGLQLPGRIAGWYKPVWKDFFNQHLKSSKITR